MSELRVTIADVPMGGMKQVEDGDDKALFVCDAAGVRAFQAKCPHYGAPLAKGLICGSTLYCPWHKAAFDIGDGLLLEPPALEGLRRYPVRLEGTEAVATLEPAAAPKPDRRLADTTLVIVGSGAAAVSAATTLRREGFAGRIQMVTREKGQPYDRPKLSKNFLAKKTEPSAMALEKDFFGAHDVEAITGPAMRIEPRKRQVTLADGTILTADHLLVATGSEAVVPHFAGDDLGRIFALRSLDDAIAISDAAEGAKTIVVIGGGFIGLEAAAFLTKRGLKATIVAPEALPLAKRFGDDVAKAIKAYHEGNGLRFVQGKVAGFEGTGDVAHVELESGESLPADLVLIGAGAKPETDAIVGLPLRDDGGLEADTRPRDRARRLGGRRHRRLPRAPQRHDRADRALAPRRAARRPCRARDPRRGRAVRRRAVLLEQPGRQKARLCRLRARLGRDRDKGRCRRARFHQLLHQGRHGHRRLRDRPEPADDGLPASPRCGPRARRRTARHGRPDDDALGLNRTDNLRKRAHRRAGRARRDSARLGG